MQLHRCAVPKYTPNSGAANCCKMHSVVCVAAPPIWAVKTHNVLPIDMMCCAQ
jgi:hypothetical protein